MLLLPDRRELYSRLNFDVGGDVEVDEHGNGEDF